MTFYRKIIKSIFDRLLGIIALIVLSWLFLLIAVLIYIDEPGPVFFYQKRVGKKKNDELTYFNIIKFRTMKMDTPHDTPTHLLDEPERWITKIGKILRKTSLDELPQIWNIAINHNLSIVGPRPCLWNQIDLIEEREKYGANDVLPGLTGLAQISGRDELSIEKKAKLDGDYVKALSASNWEGFKIDAKCFFGTIVSVFKREGVVEGARGSNDE